MASAPARHYAFAALLVAATVTLSLVLRAFTHLPDLEMLFLLAVMATAVWFGRGPSLLAAGLGVASYDLFFVPPYLTFSVDDKRYFLTFAMMFGVGFLISELVGRLRRQEQDALAREDRTAVLYGLTRELASTDQAMSIAAIATRHAVAVFSAKAFIVESDPEGEMRTLGHAPEDARLDEKDRGVARWSLEHDESSGLGTDTLPGARILCTPLRVGQSHLGVFALEPRERDPLDHDQRVFLDVFSRQIAVALERARLAEEAKQAALRAKTEEMRSSLLSTVSHDLRTPLASITGAATSLRDDEKLPAEARTELVESIVVEAERMERLVHNLLDMTRLESGDIALHRDWVPLDEIIGSALTRLEARLQDRAIAVRITPDVLLVLVDPVLFEQVFVNLLENVEKYTPRGTRIDIRGRCEGDRVAIEISDRGPGFPPGAETRIFEKFFRGPQHGVSGAGLGLPICKGIVEAHGGAIRAENRPAGGATLHIVIPAGGTPPAMPSPEGDS